MTRQAGEGQQPLSRRRQRGSDLWLRGHPPNLTLLDRPRLEARDRRAQGPLLQGSLLSGQRGEKAEERSAGQTDGQTRQIISVPLRYSEVLRPLQVWEARVGEEPPDVGKGHSQQITLFSPYKLSPTESHLPSLRPSLLTVLVGRVRGWMSQRRDPAPSSFPAVLRS